MAAKDPQLQVPHKEIPRLRYPQDLSRESFERDFAAKSEPVTWLNMGGANFNTNHIWKTKKSCKQLHS